MGDITVDRSSALLERFKSLIEVNTRISSNYGDPRTLLVSILESALTVVGCEAGSILLFHREDDCLYFHIALGPKGKELDKVKVDRNSLAGWVYDHRKSQIVNNPSEDARFNAEVQSKINYTTRNILAVPMVISGECVGVIELINRLGNNNFRQEDLSLLELLAAQAAVAYQNAEDFNTKKEQVRILQNTVNSGDGYHSFVAESPVVKDILDVVKNVAVTNSSVLIIGESGVGKELFAEQVHLNSSRRNAPFIRVSCAALSPSLLESELFGHVKGAFTDAVSNQKGRFEMADKGTLFLDEIGELPLDLQAKLLRVIQERRFERVGSSETISVDVRLIAATNRNLEQMVSDGTFRGDLYYRLNVFPINVPPLRERAEDIKPLSEFFLAKFCKETKKVFSGFSAEAQRALIHYYWPGNIRELENIIERSCILGNPPLIQLKDLHLPSVDSVEPEGNIEEIAVQTVNSTDRTLKTAINGFKRDYIRRLLVENNWNQTETARILDVQRTYLTRLLKELNIKK